MWLERGSSYVKWDMGVIKIKIVKILVSRMAVSIIV